VAALAALALSTPPAPAASEPLNDLAKSNIEVVIDFLRSVGNFLEADNIQQWLDDGKFTMDEDLGQDVGAETDGDGNITVRKADIAMVNLSGASRLKMFASIVELAAILVHEKVHAHQAAPNWFHSVAFSLSLIPDVWEVEAYHREIEVRAEWINWLIDEYNDEVAIYNPKVKEFNAFAEALKESGEVDKEAMQASLDKVQKDLKELLDKKNNIVDMIVELLSRLDVLKKANFEKGNYLADKIKSKWESAHGIWKDNVSVLGASKERLEDWAEWLKQDPPPLPDLSETLPTRSLMDTTEIGSARQGAVQDRQDWEQKTDSEKLVYVMPFLEQVAAEFPRQNRVNVDVYTDMSFVAYYNRTEQTVGLDLNRGAIGDVKLGGYASAGRTVLTSESAILRVLSAADVSAAVQAEMATGHVQTKAAGPPCFLIPGGALVLFLVSARRKAMGTRALRMR